MPLPENNQFDTFISSLTNRQEYASEEHQRHSISTMAGRDESGRYFDESQLNIWYLPVGEFTWDSFVKRLSRELNERGCATNEAICFSVIDLFCYYARAMGLQNTTIFNAFLNYIAPVELNQIAILSKQFTQQSWNFEIGSFVVGEIDLSKIKSYSRRAGSDYYERYRNEIKERIAVQRKAISIKALDVYRIYGDTQSVDLSLDVVNNGKYYWSIWMYFEHIGIFHRMQFFELLIREQDLMYALEEIRLHPDGLHYAEMLFLSAFISFNRDKKTGWITPIGTSPKITIRTVDNFSQRIANFNNWLSVQVGKPELNKNAIFYSLEAFVRFVNKGHEFKEEGKHNEAFLHYVIALDLMFGERESLSSSIAKRVAVICYKTLDMSYVDALKRIKEIYNDRSKYVHEGKNVKENLLPSLIAVCQSIVRVLIKLSAMNYDDTIFPANWFKQLDLAAASLEAEADLGVDFYRGIGLMG